MEKKDVEQDARPEMDVSLEVLVQTLSWGLQREFFAYVYDERLHNYGNRIWVDNEAHRPVFKIVMRRKAGDEYGLNIWVSDDGFVEVNLRAAPTGCEELGVLRVDGIDGLNVGRCIERIAEKYFPQKNGSGEQRRLVKEFWESRGV
jgi:hypothetical protein